MKYDLLHAFVFIIIFAAGIYVGWNLKLPTVVHEQVISTTTPNGSFEIAPVSTHLYTLYPDNSDAYIKAVVKEARDTGGIIKF